MSRQEKLTIGLFGFGVVGEGIYEVLKSTPSLNASVRKICIKHPEKKRAAPAELFTTSAADILNDEEINLVVELIDDANEAFVIVTTALRNKKAVVSANKKMIAENLEALLSLQEEYGSPFLYEAAVCGSVPVIRNLEEYYDNDMLSGICGIVNGSTNFILSKIINEGLGYNEALQQAQGLGFAESNPELDVSGRDALNKLTILLMHAFGIRCNPNSIICRGITAVTEHDAVVASEKGYKIKLIARAHKLGVDKVVSYVLPQFVRPDSPLYNVKNEFNGLVIESRLADKQFLSGKGAGRYPTSSAVLSDIAALRYNYRYEYRKLSHELRLSVSDDIFLRVYVSFSEWNQVNKWDFESIEEFHSTSDRQHLVGIIHLQKLKEAAWFEDETVSVIAMPDCFIQKNELLVKSIKRLSVHLAGAV